MIGLVVSLAIAMQVSETACPVGVELDGPEGRAWDSLPLTALQTVGTHNSYKQAIPPAELAALIARNPDAAGLDYSHPPLSDQLDMGMRNLEIDFVYDPEGGRFANPLMPAMMAGQEGSTPYDASGMDAPGFKVLHIPDIDVRTSCSTLIACMSEIRDWSLAHPDHAPIMVMFNAKTGGLDAPGATQALDFDREAFAALDAEFAQVFAPGHLIVPDEVRGDHATLREGVLAGGWPTLGDARGRILLVLDERGEKADAYRGEAVSLEGRMMFTLSETIDADHAAIFILNDPFEDFQIIPHAALSGFLVRTRADANTMEARTNDGSRRDAAFDLGAHWISTDYPQPRAEWSDYQVSLPDGLIVRCNPMTTVPAP
ncbi:phosphatidylinositol-specific phospholipase C1-like protein [Oceanicaulis sp. LC35]|uniref:phosphatidylinositol-specific phospholipase C1-like protein n=1 Tax=Oceanicaulis sp. LC35 TaxID=3349635 RepID=UPI003F86F417